MTAQKITVVERIKRDFKTINLGIFFDEATRAYPEKVAIIDLTGDSRSYTYMQLETEVCRATQALAAVGLRRRDRCVIALPNGVEFLATFLGALRLGVIPVPMNYRLSVDTMQGIVRDADCRAIVGSHAEAGTCCGIADDLGIDIRLSTDAEKPGWTNFRSLASQQRDIRTVEAMAFDDVAFQPYTSGSTGVPKGIALTHGGMIWGIEHSQQRHSRGGRGIRQGAGSDYGPR